LRTRKREHFPDSSDRALLDLNYYLPCRVLRCNSRMARLPAAHRVIASAAHWAATFVERRRGASGIPASYIGIALQNASLYARLEEKIVEFEPQGIQREHRRVINVGIFAIDLNDRIESWNAQMELCTLSAVLKRSPGTTLRVPVGVH